MGALCTTDDVGVDAVRELDFCPALIDVEEKELRDERADEYLSPILDSLATMGVELVPVKVDSDGSCLPHAISRCMVGKEILFDWLRGLLEKELTENQEAYKSVFQQGMDEEAWKSHWNEIIEEAKPTHGCLTTRWLGPGEHLVGMANVLRRPILLLDREINSQSSGLFVPFRLKRSECCNSHGIMPSPLVIGWASEEHNHFVALISTTRPLEVQTKRCKDAWPEVWDSIENQLSLKRVSSAIPEQMNIKVPVGKAPGDLVVLRNQETGEEYAARVPENAGESFMWTVPSRQDVLSGKLQALIIQLYARNAPAIRLKGCTTLYTVLNNLVDALTSVSSSVEQKRKVRLDNKVIQRNIVRVHGAVEFLKEIGFEEWKDPETSQLFLRFNGDLLQSEICDNLCLARDMVSLFRNSPNNVVLGSGQVAMDSLVLGEELYGEISTYATVEKAFVFGSGPMVHAGPIASKLREKFQQLVADSPEFLEIQWDDQFEYDRFMSRVRCSHCKEVQYWNASIDGIIGELSKQECQQCKRLLSVEDTGQRRLSEFVAKALKKKSARRLKDESYVGRTKCCE